MEERNEFLESDGLFWQSDTHEWFKDNNSTQYAHSEKGGISLKNIYAFILRNKKTGEYDRVLMDKKINNIIFATKTLEGLACHIDMLKFYYENKATQTDS